MKKLIIIFYLFFAPAILYAQQSDIANASTKPGLTRAELIFAQQQYKEMMKCDTYKAREELREKKADMNNGNKLPLPNPTKFDGGIGYRKTLKAWYVENLPKTKYKSVDDAMADFDLLASLTEKMGKQFPKVFEAFRKATKEQLEVILEPEFQKGFDKRYEVKKN
jgi:formate dehydrogenase maturation protein FdhE